MTPGAYGTYTALLAVITVVQSAGFFWLQTAFLRLHSTHADADAGNRLASGIKFLFLALSLLLAAAWVPAALVASAYFGTALWFAGLPLILLGGWLSLVRAWIRVTNRPWRFVLTDAVQGIGAIVLGLVGLLLWPAEPLPVVLGASGAAILAAGLSRDLLRIPLPDLRAVKPILLEVWSYGAPLALAAFLGSVLAVSDRFLVALLVGPEAAGAYSAGYAIADRATTLALVPMAFAMKPLIFAAFDRHGEVAAERLMARSARWLIGIGFPVTTMLICVPAPIAQLLAGGAMGPAAAMVVPWVAIGSLLAAILNLHLGLVFQLSRRTGALLAVVAPAATGNVVANLILLPIFGAIAAAWTTAGAYALALLLAVLFGRRHARIRIPVADVLVTLTACLPMAALLRLNSPEGTAGLILTGSVAAATYGGTLMFLRSVPGFRRLLR